MCKGFYDDTTLFDSRITLNHQPSYPAKPTAEFIYGLLFEINAQKWNHIIQLHQYFTPTTPVKQPGSFFVTAQTEHSSSRMCFETWGKHIPSSKSLSSLATPGHQHVPMANQVKDKLLALPASATPPNNNLEAVLKHVKVDDGRWGRYLSFTR